jgi:hypothetical protein
MKNPINAENPMYTNNLLRSWCIVRVLFWVFAYPHTFANTGFTPSDFRAGCSKTGTHSSAQLIGKFLNGFIKVSFSTCCATVARAKSECSPGKQEFFLLIGGGVSMSNQEILFAEDTPAAYNPEQKEKDRQEVEELQPGEPMRRLRRLALTLLVWLAAAMTQFLLLLQE